MKSSTILGIAGAVFGAGVVATLAIKAAAKSPAQPTPGAAWPIEPGIVPPPPDAIWLKLTGTPTGAFDSSQFWADWFSAHSVRSADVTAEQRARILSAGLALGADPQGYIRWRPTGNGQLTALAIADQLERETTPTAQVLSSGVKEYVTQAGSLPENPVTKAMGIT